MGDQHIVQQPKFIFFIKIAQLALALLILALVSFSLAVIKSIDGSFGFNIFCCIYTFIAGGYLIGTPIWSPALWNCWAALALEAVGAVFWLCAFATMASFASIGSAITLLMRRDYSTDYSGYTGYDTSSYSSGSTSSTDYTATDYYSNYEAEAKKYIAAWKCTAAAAGLGGLVWVLTVISLVVYSIFLHRHRTNPENANLPADGSPAIEEGKVASDHEMQAQTQQY